MQSLQGRSVCLLFILILLTLAKSPQTAALAAAQGDTKDRTDTENRSFLGFHTPIYLGDYSSLFQNIQDLSPIDVSAIKVYPPGDRATDDNCYIISLKEDTPESILSLLSKYITHMVSGETVSVFSNLFKGMTVCFSRELENKILIELLEKVSWIQVVEHDSTLYQQLPLNAGPSSDSCELCRIQKNAPWGLARISQPKRQSLRNIYEYEMTGEGVNIYLIDSGVHESHPEFDGRAKIVYRAPGILRNTRGDCSGHGTEVASIIGGKSVGVAKKATINSLQVLGCDGQGKNSDLIASLEWISKNFKSPGIINMSLGGPRSATLDRAVESISAMGIPVVVAAGNGATDACNTSPAGLSSIVTVGASTLSDERADFSNYGRCVDIFAPGHLIQVARPPTPSSHGSPLFFFSSGTSLAAPFVSGVMALLLQKCPSLNTKALWMATKRLSLSDALRRDTLKNSPNLLLQSIPADIGDISNLIKDGDLSSDNEDKYNFMEDENLSENLLSWIMISTIVSLSIVSLFAAMAGAKYVKNYFMKPEDFTRGRPR